MRDIGRHLINNPRNAALVALVATLLPLIYIPGDFIAGIVVALVTYTRGTKAGLTVLAWVALPALAMLVLGRVGNFDVALLRAALIFAFALLMRKTQSWRFLLEVATLIGVIVVVAVHLYMPNIQSFWTQHLLQLMQQMEAETSWTITARQSNEVVLIIAQFATGMLVLAFLLAMFFQLLVARYWQTLLDKSVDFMREFSEIRFGMMAAIVLIVVLIGVSLKYAVMIDLLPLALVPFMGAGLSVMHIAAQSNKILMVCLVLLYAGLFILPAVSVILFACVGFVDCWVDFRGRQQTA